MKKKPNSKNNMIIWIVCLIYIILVFLHTRYQTRLRKTREIEEFLKVNTRRPRLFSVDPSLNFPRH